ncbi:HlyD family efflux transporter periplasmic adaptor subunit [Caulobacter mirabilis]|uniref:EmrA/EmrK family multidrug efflux transporter periplasmic adaptor subunit n=1 Tax=Caulobacter mirabilis TaxID=69666 RepID=A0A2D2AZ81_9CAUL|nr:HlyD family efflux transporter periplasmic adaptor subunit [Caulobacter mirabilis]ATQ43316.1 EmrA/EmrK family multidrug efflux transporter periplasmic adaptor subunit [Caulobacter mirabilis]
MPDDIGSTPQAGAATGALPSTAASPNGARRKRLFLILGALIVVAALLWLLYWLLVGSRHVTTDNAYVQADVAQVSALVSGPIVSAPVRETQAVKTGDVLAVIDPADYRLAVDRARAELGQAERRVGQYFANDEAFAAQTAARDADIARADAALASARSDFNRAQVEYGRRTNLSASGAVSGDELTQAENRYEASRAALTAAQAGVAQARAAAAQSRGQQRAAAALISGSSAADNPEVAAARARLAQAELDLERTVIRSPVDGLVTRKTIQVGQKIANGAPVMSVVPIQSAFVDANFKEVQLRKVRPGQPVVLTSDLYGKGVKFHGRVQGVAGGTGSAFALIPAQNATGNWIKVVQRIPVRIVLDPKELAEHPLRVGLSMDAEIDISGR